ncbi:MAG: rod shape-determining protein MreC [Actinomycetota bacterium]|nr:rod shape-determining protein MreC [Actinomycetota bacterium]
MPERRASRGLLAVLVLVSLVLLSVDYRQGDVGVVAAVQRGALTVFGPVAEGFATVVRPIGGAFRSIGAVGSLRERNAALELEVRRLRRERESWIDLQRENDELRAQVRMRRRLGLTTTGAQVIAQPPSSVERSVLLDAGAASGLAPGMAVINELGLVGKLTEVTASNSRVELLTSPSAGYGVRIAASGEEGLLTGSGASPFQLEMFDPEIRASNGDEVVTLLFSGTSIPGGIPVGVVTDRGNDTSRFLRVQPYVDFTRLSVVQVVLDFPRQPSRLPPEQRVPEPRRPRPAPPGGGQG